MASTAGAWGRIGALASAGAAMMGLIAPAVQAAVPERSATRAANVHWMVALDNGVNIRTSPGLDGGVVGTLNKGDKIIVTVTGVEGGEYPPVCGSGAPSSYWTEVDHFGTLRYVAGVCLADFVPPPGR